MKGKLFEIVTLFIVVIFIVAIAVWGFFVDVAPYTGITEQHEQVEVIGKRIRQSSSVDNIDYNTYIVVFEFPNGSVKELQVGRARKRSNKGRDVYDSINEGDTGILTYKEMKNLEERIKTEDMRFDGRRFISFEKDPASALND